MAGRTETGSDDLSRGAPLPGGDIGWSGNGSRLAVRGPQPLVSEGLFPLNVQGNTPWETGPTHFHHGPRASSCGPWGRATGTRSHTYSSSRSHRQASQFEPFGFCTARIPPEDLGSVRFA